MNRLIWSNAKHPDEWAYIEPAFKLMRLCYKSKHGGLYNDYFKSMKGAKTSFTRYVGYKTEWEEEGAKSPQP